MSQTKPKILLVEDEPAIQDIFKEYFSQIYDIVSALNGKEALKVLEQNSDVDCIVMDYNMPDMKGTEFLEEQKQIEKIKNIPVVMHTAQPDFFLLPSLPADAPIAGYIKKPANLNSVSSIIEKALTNTKAEIEVMRQRIIDAQK